MIKIYGVSDDTVIIEGATYSTDFVDCFDEDVRFTFTDGTVIRIGYNKPDLGIWYIIVEQKGTAEQSLTVCEDEDADPYSDVFCIDAEIVKHKCIGH